MNDMENNRYYDDYYPMAHDYRSYRDYDRRGGRINNRDNRMYRNYRGQDYYDEIEMTAENMRENYRAIEDMSEMAPNSQDKNMLMKIAQKEKENYNYLKQLAEK